jgi:hypothetical protein
MSTVSAFKAHVPFRRLITVMALLLGLLAVAATPAMAATPRQETGVRPTALVLSSGGFDPGFRIRTKFIGPVPVSHTIYFSRFTTDTIAQGTIGALAGAIGYYIGRGQGAAIGGILAASGGPPATAAIERGVCLAITFVPTFLVIGPLPPVMWSLYPCY